MSPLLMMDSLLDTGDKIASIMGAVVGILSLAVALVALKLQRQESARDDVSGTRSMSPARRVSVGAAVAALLGGLVAALVPIREVSVAAAITSGLLVVVAIVALVRHRSAAPELPAAVRSLLSAQRGASSGEGYHFFDGHVPGLQDVHVAQRSIERGNGDEVERPRQPTTFGAALRAHRHVVLVGPAGGGKSTTAAMTVADAADWWLRSRRLSDQPATGRMIPVLVKARSVVGDELLIALSRRLSEQYGVAVSRDTFLHPGRAVEGWIVIVDGLDEVTDTYERSAILRKLSVLATDSSERLRFVVLTRPLAATEMIELGRIAQLGIYDLLPFDGHEFERFTERWFAARQLPDNPGAVASTATRFREAVAAAHLQNLVRIPLLATLAAVVFERRPGGLLPAGRPAVYESFVGHLLSGRDRSVGLAVQLLGRRPTEERTIDAVASAVRGVLEAAADADQASSRRVDVLDVAERESTPLLTLLGLPSAPIGWRDRLHSLLLSSGLVVADGNSLAFVHESIAEYLASAVQVNRFDLAEWRARMISPSTRGAALFLFARLSDARREQVLVEILAAGATLEASYVVADGVPVTSERRSEILQRLYADLRRGHPLIVELVRVAIDLCVDPRVRASVTEIGDDPAMRPWLRARIARDLADTDPVGSTARLLELMQDPLLPDDIRAWCARELTTTIHRDRATTLLRMLWDRNEPPTLETDPADVTSSLLGTEALTEILADQSQDPQYRVNAARNLLREADRAPASARATAREVLLEISEDATAPGRVRIAACDLLLREADDGPRILDAVRVVATDPVVPVRDRVDAIRRLHRHRAVVPGSVVLELFQSGVGEQARRDILAALIDDRSPDVNDTLLLIVEQPDHGSRWRVEAAVELLGRGDHRVLGAARELVRDAESDDHATGRLILAIGADGGADAQLLLAAAAADSSTPDNRRHEAFVALRRISETRAASTAAGIVGQGNLVPDALLTAAVTTAARLAGDEGRQAVVALLATESRVGEEMALRSTVLQRRLRAAQVRKALGIVAASVPLACIDIIGAAIVDSEKPGWLRIALVEGLGRRSEPEVPARILALRDRLDAQDSLRAIMLSTVLMPSGREFRYDVAEGLLAARRPDDTDTGPEVLHLVPRTGEQAALLIMDAAVVDDTLPVEVRAEALCQVCRWDRERGRQTIIRLLTSGTTEDVLVLSQATSIHVRDLLLFESIDEDLEWWARLRAAKHAYDLDAASAVDAVVRLGTSAAVAEEARTSAVLFLLDRGHRAAVAYVVRELRQRESDLDADFAGLLAELEAAIEQHRSS